MTQIQTQAQRDAIDAHAGARFCDEGKSMKHTPGPWKALGLLSPFGWVIKYDKNGKESIAYIQAYDIEDDNPEPYGPWSDENKANHDLVLASPDLLEAAIALKDVCNRPSCARTRAEAWRDLDKAIAKATGAAA